MNITMHIITSKEDENVYNEVCNLLNSFYKPLSIWPYRPYEGMRDSLEFFVTFSINDSNLKELLNKLCDSFEEGEYGDEWQCYGITSKVFHKDVYYIHIDAYK